MCGLRQSIQPIVQLDHALQEAHRLQTFRLRSLRTSFPTKSRPEAAQGKPTLGIISIAAATATTATAAAAAFRSQRIASAFQPGLFLLFIRAILRIQRIPKFVRRFGRRRRCSCGRSFQKRRSGQEHELPQLAVHQQSRVRPRLLAQEFATSVTAASLNDEFMSSSTVSFFVFIHFSHNFSLLLPVVIYKFFFRHFLLFPPFIILLLQFHSYRFFASLSSTCPQTISVCILALIGLVRTNA